jgi:hypothetical protein
MASRRVSSRFYPGTWTNLHSRFDDIDRQGYEQEPIVNKEVDIGQLNEPWRVHLTDSLRGYLVAMDAIYSEPGYRVPHGYRVHPHLIEMVKSYPMGWEDVYPYDEQRGNKYAPRKGVRSYRSQDPRGNLAIC